MPDPPLPRLRRRQWALLASGTPHPSHWQWVELGGGYGVAHDADLSVYRATTQTASATLLGFAIDHHNPSAATETILREILASPDAVGKAQNLAGRWALHLRIGGRSLVLHDACGLRQVVWTRRGRMACASDPSFLAETFGFERDPDAAARSVKSREFRGWREAWWPGTTTPYREIEQLLPNHLLDLDTGETERYWPSSSIRTLTTDDAAGQGAQLLQALVAAATHRFEVALPLTAGWDSRLLLAATAAMNTDCWHYTLAHPALYGNTADLVIAGDLLRAIGEPHHVVRCPERMSRAFGAVYRDSVTSPHELWGEMVEGLWRAYPTERVCLRGNANEIARTYHRWYGDHSVTPADLAVCHGARGNAFVAERLAEWQREAERVAERAGIHVLDLFYWEQKIGRWQAEYQLEFDLAQETYTPYNHRPLLEMLLSSPERSRRAPQYELHRKMIERLEPSLLDVPVNPMPRLSRVRTRLDHLARDAARRTGLYRRLRGTNA
jgi:hypothetical protein